MHIFFKVWSSKYKKYNNVENPNTDWNQTIKNLFNYTMFVLFAKVLMSENHAYFKLLIQIY